MVSPFQVPCATAPAESIVLAPNWNYRIGPIAGGWWPLSRGPICSAQGSLPFRFAPMRPRIHRTQFTVQRRAAWLELQHWMRQGFSASSCFKKKGHVEQARVVGQHKKLSTCHHHANSSTPSRESFSLGSGSNRSFCTFSFLASAGLSLQFVARTPIPHSLSCSGIVSVPK